MKAKLWIIAAALAVAALTGSIVFAGKGDPVEKAAAAFDSGNLARHVKTLASDEFEGRAPGTRGEDLTVRYISEEFRMIGLKPGAGGGFIQEVPMVEITNDPTAVLHVKGRGPDLAFPSGSAFVGWTLRAKEVVTVADSEMVFVGYGVVAPEHNWNDYAGVDARGKTVVMLVNDPGFATKDPDLFNGKAMTYYGRWMYKFEEAARQGAAAALLVHETEPASYDWGVVRNSWMGARYSLSTPDGNASRCALESWISLDSAKAIFKAAGFDFDPMKAAANRRGFKAVPLGQKASVTMRDRVKPITSRNVVGLVPGSKRPDEVIIFTAHWDHFGINPALPGKDKIFNGAVDNATGVAGLIELGRAFMNPAAAPERTIIFLAVTAEEQGMLGSAYYAANPIFPLAKTVAVLNLESLNIFGPTRDVVVIGYGQCDLDEYIRAAAAEQGRVLSPDPTPEDGGFFRSDHFPFARVGVPAMEAGSGTDDREKGPEFGRRIRDAWGPANYHRPSDEYSPSWNFAGMIEDLDMYYRIGFRLSHETSFPGWKPGSEFKAKRDAMMAK